MESVTSGPLHVKRLHIPLRVSPKKAQLVEPVGHRWEIPQYAYLPQELMKRCYTLLMVF